VQAGFGAKASFADLWYSNVDVLARVFPANMPGKDFDHSSADLALASHLAFWCGGNHERVAQLMRRSALVRSKWDRDDYFNGTIRQACAGTRNWYNQPPARHEAPSTPGDQVTSGAAGAAAAMSIPPTQPAAAPAISDDRRAPYADVNAAAVSLLSRYVFLRSENKYYERSTRTLITPEALNRSEASRMPTIDDGSGRRWKAADLFDRCPNKTEAVGEGYYPGAADIYTDPTGRVLVNTYKAPSYQLLEPTPYERQLFNEFLKHLFPEQNEWLETLLDSYGWLLRNRGKRVAFMQILTGEQKGTGKSLLMQAIPRILFGMSNVSSPDAKATESSFSDYLHQKQIVVFDELFESDDMQAAEARMNARSAWITDDFSLPIHPKGKRAYEQRPNTVSFFATSNYPEKAVFMPEDDRRYAIEETKAGHLPRALIERFAMDFLSSERAPGVLASILLERNVSSFDPRKRPVRTAARENARRASLSPVAQEIVEAWEEQDEAFVYDFAPLATVRKMLFDRGLRNVPGNYRLARELTSAFRAINVTCAKSAAKPRLSTGRSHVWIWRNVDKWKLAQGAELEKAMSMPA
jgi:hypothetical protein